MLELRGVRKRYGSVTVIHDATGDIPARGLTLLAGENGSGKTTLLACIMGLERYDGEIRWAGRPVRQGSGTFWPAFDDAPFFPRLTGRQNLRLLGYPGAPYPGRGERASAGADAVPGAVQYLSAERLAARVSTYSAGERRRLALTLALSSDAPFLVLDEPMAALDDAAVELLRRDLEARRATTGLLVTGHGADLLGFRADASFTIVDGVLRRSPSAGGAVTEPAAPRAVLR